MTEGGEEGAFSQGVALGWGWVAPLGLGNQREMEFREEQGGVPKWSLGTRDREGGRKAPLSGGTVARACDGYPGGRLRLGMATVSVARGRKWVEGRGWLAMKWFE